MRNKQRTIKNYEQARENVLQQDKVISDLHLEIEALERELSFSKGEIKRLSSEKQTLSQGVESLQERLREQEIKNSHCKECERISWERSSFK